MPRRRHDTPPTPAGALRAAIEAMTRQMRTAPPDRAGAMARTLAGLARDPTVLEQKSQEQRADEHHEMQEQFGAELERIIRLRTHERVNAILERRGLAPDEPLPPTDYVSCVREPWG